LRAFNSPRDTSIHVNMNTIRLIYASVAEADLDYEDLTSVMRRAVERNTERGITGVLCYGDHEFLQVLEGERGVVSQLYSSIVRDTRHRDCELLSVSDISERLFADWSMMLIGWDDKPTEHRRALVLKYSGSAQFMPKHMTGEQATQFLRALAEHERLHGARH
jgi:hypothetical protein